MFAKNVSKTVQKVTNHGAKKVELKPGDIVKLFPSQFEALLRNPVKELELLNVRTIKPTLQEFAVKIVGDNISTVETVLEGKKTVKKGDVVGVNYGFWRFALTQPKDYDVYVTFEQPKEKAEPKKEEIVVEEKQVEEKKKKTRKKKTKVSTKKK